MESGGFRWTQSRRTLVESGRFCQTPWTLADSGGLDIQSWPMSHQHNPGLESAGVWRNPLESAGVGGGVYSPPRCVVWAISMYFFYLFHVLCILTNFFNYIYVQKRFGWVAQQKMGPNNASSCHLGPLYFFKNI